MVLEEQQDDDLSSAQEIGLMSWPWRGILCQGSWSWYSSMESFSEEFTDNALNNIGHA